MKNSNTAPSATLEDLMAALTGAGVATHAEVQQHETRFSLKPVVANAKQAVIVRHAMGRVAHNFSNVELAEGFIEAQAQG